MSMYQCEKCGKPFNERPFYIPEGDNWHIFCSNCGQLNNSCHFCRHRDTCSFETDPSTLPKMVQQRIQQGPMISLQTVKNPSRIEITCKKGCLCYDPNYGCMKDFNYCNNLSHIYEKEDE